MRRFAWVTLLLPLALAAGCAATARPAATVPTAVAAEPLPLDPAVTVGRLPNGLTYYVRRNEEPARRAELWLAVAAGSVLEDDDQRGLAHFVEHMAFNGTEHFAKHEIVDFLERAGMRFGPDVNAYTGFDETVYTLRIPTDEEQTVETALQVLADWARGIAFEPEEVEQERGVVLEEWRSGRGAQARIMDRQLPLLFAGSRYAERIPIGDEAALHAASPAAMARFYRDWYRPELMALIAVGDFDPGAIEKRIRTHFGKIPRPAAERPKPVYPVPDHDATLVSIETDPEQTDTVVGVYYKLPRRESSTKADYRRTLIEELYHAAINARLDERTLEADPPFLFAYSASGRFVRTRDVYFQTTGVKAGGLDRGLEALLSEVERVDRHGFTATELERQKAELLRFLGQLRLEGDKRESAELAEECLSHFLDDESMPGIERELQLAQELLPEIGLEELNGLAGEWISERNRVVLVAAPASEAATLPAAPELLHEFESVAGRELPAYVDRVRDEPLLPVKPAPGAIVERSELPEIGVTRWQLSNGVTVVLKPTDFKNDEILLEGSSPGGLSLVTDEQYASAEYAGWIVSTSGLGRFSEVELDKSLSGKIADAGTDLAEFEEVFSASASPADVETMFELLFLSITAPRRDEAAFGAFKERARGMLENRTADPETVFSDRMRQVLWQDHPRRQPPSVERLEGVDLDVALDVYRERMADLGDATFVIVGNFEIDAIEPLVRTYLGGLPAAGRNESWRDVGLRHPPGANRVAVNLGLEPKSSVEVVFHGDAAWSPELEHDFESLADALDIRLREVLREELGATYGVTVGGRFQVRPRESYSLSIAFGCAPDHVEELIRALFSEIDAVRKDGVAAAVVAKVREAQLREFEEKIEENDFWVEELAESYRYGRDPRRILDYGKLAESVSSERLRDAARLLLDPGRYVLGVLGPEPAPR